MFSRVIDVGPLKQFRQDASGRHIERLSSDLCHKCAEKRCAKHAGARYDGQQRLHTEILREQIEQTPSEKTRTDQSAGDLP